MMSKYKRMIEKMIPEQSTWPWPIFLVMLCLCLAVSSGFRHAQYLSWKNSPRDYFSETGVPMMSTTDAYYWLRWAREYREGTFTPGSPDPLRGTTEGGVHPQKPNSSPISQLIAQFSRITGLSIENSGIHLTTVLSSLFIIFFALHFQLKGHPAAGIIGAIVASLCEEYYYRTSVGRVDTDALNLFFFCAISFFIAITNHKRNAITMGAVILAGLATRFFQLWYEHTFFILPYFLTLIFYLILHRKNPLVIILSGITFILAVDYGDFTGSFNQVYQQTVARLFPANLPQSFSASSAQGIQPRIIDFITEAERIGFMNTLAEIIRPEHLALLGLIGFLAFALLRPKTFIPFAPMILLGLLSLINSRRMAMYLAPFIGVGFGYALMMLIQTLSKRFGEFFSRPKTALAVQLSATVLLCIVLIPCTGISYVPAPTLPTDVYNHLVKLKPKLSENSSLWNFWNYGYVLVDLTGKTVFHDGGNQNFPVSFLAAHGLAATNPAHLYNIASFVERKGNNGINELTRTKPHMNDVVNTILSESAAPHQDIFVIFTRNMIRQFESLYELGSWDFNSGSGLKTGYRQIGCTGLKNGILNCMGGNADLNQGLINGKPKLSRAIITGPNGLIKKNEYDRPGETLEVILMDNNILSTILIDEKVYASNFNQMYLLGQYDKSLFEPVYDGFPSIRVFKLKK